MKDRMFLVACVVLVGLALCSLATCGRKNAEMDKLHDAVISGDLQEVNVLIKDNPGLVFSRDKYGRTPLHWAVFGGHRDVVEVLLATRPRLMLRTTMVPRRCSSRRVCVGRMWWNCYCSTRPMSMSRANTVRRLCTGQPIWATKTSQRYCWPTRPMSMPRTRTARRLCATRLMVAMTT